MLAINLLIRLVKLCLLSGWWRMLRWFSADIYLAEVHFTSCNNYHFHLDNVESSFSFFFPFWSLSRVSLLCTFCHFRMSFSNFRCIAWSTGGGVVSAGLVTKNNLTTMGHKDRSKGRAHEVRRSSPLRSWILKWM